METFGAVMSSRRHAMEMSLSGLSQRMGGSPSPSFLNRIETGQVSPTRRIVERLAGALRLPPDLLLNAAGFTATDQEIEALKRLREILGDDVPVQVQVPVVDPDDPERVTGERRARLMTVRETARVVDLEGPTNEPFVGEVLYSIDREPRDGSGVLVVTNGRLGAWTYREAGDKRFIENGRKERRGEFEVVGVILRVVRETDLS